MSHAELSHAVEVLGSRDRQHRGAGTASGSCQIRALLFLPSVLIIVSYLSRRVFAAFNMTKRSLLEGEAALCCRDPEAQLCVACSRRPADAGCRELL